MKILIYTHEFVPREGGVATYNYELANGLTELGHEVIVLATSYSTEDSILDKKMPFNVVRTNLPIYSIMESSKSLVMLPATAYRFIKVLRHYMPDHVLITEHAAHESAAFARLYYPFRFTLTVHGTEVYLHFARAGIKGRLKRWLMKRFFHKADNIISVSVFTQRLLKDHVCLPPKKTAVIRNGIDFKTLFKSCNKYKSQQIREKLGLDRKKVLLTVGRLTPRKGHDNVIKALPKVIDEFPEATYVIVGTGNYRQTLEKIVKDKKLSSKVIFAGSVSEEELPSYYEICDIFIMLSRRSGNTVEGLGFAFLEAMVFKKPLIGGDHGGVREVIDDGKNGYLVDPNDFNAAAEMICNLLKDENLRKKMGKAGREKLEGEFSRQAMAQETLELL